MLKNKNTIFYQKRGDITKLFGILTDIKIPKGKTIDDLIEEGRGECLIKKYRLDVERKDLKLVAQSIVGSVSKSKNRWKNVENIGKWQSKLRKNEDSHRP